MARYTRMMHSDDKDIAKRHAAVARSRTFQNLRRVLGLERMRVLDVGCGYGEYLAAFGPQSIGITTTPEEVAYGARAGLDIRAGNAEELAEAKLEGPFDAVWANNLFEHLLAPHAFLIELKPMAKSGGKLILGVPMIPAFPTLMRLRRFRGALASNHIGFYTRRTLQLTAERAGWKVESVRPFFFRSAFLDGLLAPMAPHLYLVATNDASFTYADKKLKEWEHEPRYARLLTIVGPKQPS